ncbi:hypothetical protein SERLADRAFT_408061 [Serpula lacrymans var. lacrymans S7.9]|uniref:Uncharacterized protein n=1 Tax=Serpula lacrymans var. lacrymans (strain S7.9) TaxID=578457 RepID=F8NU43_SERL9|nr:uncharacterized protein SERLADRAFT_408061 [Serpula lacrymans var. lacrymans S7.9]EGO25809.1 hypothetical protein SERLADRAFT_408061 [Serpula lacrymans var. lacrymans S7.9]
MESNFEELQYCDFHWKVNHLASLDPLYSVTIENPLSNLIKYSQTEEHCLSSSSSAGASASASSASKPTTNIAKKPGPGVFQPSKAFTTYNYCGIEWLKENPKGTHEEFKVPQGFDQLKTFVTFPAQDLPQFSPLCLNFRTFGGQDRSVRFVTLYSTSDKFLEGCTTIVEPVEAQEYKGSRLQRLSNDSMETS